MMDPIPKTLYIPLYGKAFVSKKGIILDDHKAEEIIKLTDFNLKQNGKSKWLAYYLGMRSVVFDSWLSKTLTEWPDAIVLHIGCGLDSRVLRTHSEHREWYDVDFPNVIQERKRFYQTSETYHMIGADICSSDIEKILPSGSKVIVVMEGVSMYLTPAERSRFMNVLHDKYPNIKLLIDCYSTFAAKASKYKNPINEVGVTQVWGADSSTELIGDAHFSFVSQRNVTPKELINQLHGIENLIFRMLYGGKFASELYRIYEYEK